MADKKPKKKRETYQVFKAIDQRNRTGLGWKPEDFGIYQFTNLAKGVGAGGGGLTYKPGTALTYSQTGSAPSAINNPANTTGKFNANILPSNTPASSFMSYQDQQQVRSYVDNPKEIAAGSGPVDAVKSFLANVFDTKDTFDPSKSNAMFGYQGADNPGEFVLDSLLAGLGWGYDRLSQVTVAGMSALPGGTQTLTWDEANEVSFGQQLIANMGVSAGKVRRGEGNIFDVGAMGVFGGLAAVTDPDSPIQQRGFDITSEEDRKAFEEGPEKFWSGVADFGFVFADPLLVGGTAARLARLKWIDRPINSPEGFKMLENELQLGATVTDGTRPLSPAADFVQWATARNADGSKVRPSEEIFNHPMIKGAAMREQVSSALYHADDYETGALILRYAKGDSKAGVQLFDKRADIVDAMAKADRERIMTIAAMNPDEVRKATKVAENAFRRADNKVKELEELGLGGSKEWDLATRFRNNTLDTMHDLVDGNFDPITLATPQGVAAAKKVFNALVASDSTIAKAIDDAGQGGGVYRSINGVKSIPSNTALGRFTEKSRQRRATASYQAAATRGALVETGRAIARKDGSVAMEMKRQNMNPLRGTFWQKDEFGVGGFRRGVRVWRWMGEENPSGYVVTKGIGAQDSFREVRSVMNDVEIYSGQARTITLADGQVIQVGGVERKEQLLQMYMDAVNDTTRGSNKTALALDKIEDAMMNDILSWHGIPKENANLIKDKARQVRSDTMASLADPDRKFYVNEDGSFDSIPWLEQHLQNGTYMLNYRALEKAARLADEQGLIKSIDQTQQYISQNFMRIYGVFNDFWRPSVLLRLGYTMRNVAEGQFRAAAFTQSFDPLRYGVEAGVYSIRNTAVSFAGRKAIKTAVNASLMRQAGAANVVMPKKYQKWLGDQITAREADINRYDGIIRNHGIEIANFSPEYRDFMVGYFERVQNAALDAMVRAKAAGANADEIAARQADIDDAFKSLQSIQKIKTFTGKNEFSEIAFDQLKTHVTFFDDSVARRAALDNETVAVTLYSQQGNAKRRIFSKPIPSADGRVWQQAFSSDSPFTPVAMSLASADATQQSMLQLTMNMGENLIKAKRVKDYQKVIPTDPNYFEGLATNLRNIKGSGIGSRLIAGETDEQIVRFLMSPGQGREIMDYLMSGKKFDSEDALKQIQILRSRYDQLAPNADLREFIRVTKMDENFNGKVIENMFGAKTENGEFVNQFAPIVGSIAEEFGFKNPVDTWRATTSWLMKWLGTIPEDTLVRQPFYGVRFNQSVRESVAELESTFGVGQLTTRQVNDIYKLAHARSLKDTKDWMYTIDRRTNLGTYGEVAIPFISAAQNSITTVGRLIYNDPNTAILMAAMWRAPNAAGFEDEEGNIVIPIPHALIPDGIEEALGLDAMENWKIRKSSLNVIIPESGFGFIPRPGPIVTAPASEFMKHGLFGMSVESPEILRTFMGKEGADQFWNVYKNYLFGERQGLAPDMLSLSMLTPPVAQRVIQLIQGTDNAQFGYQYNLIYRSEILQWMGGYRDDMPTKDEIVAKTRGLTLVRLLANMTAFTPPAYESKIDPLIQAIRKIESENPEDASRIIYQQYGEYLQMVGDFSNSKNYAGMGPYANSVEIARKYSSLINDVSPGLEKLGDLSVLSMLTMGGSATSLYDDSAYGWQFSNNIPGVNVNFRDFQRPEQSWTQSRVNTGWTVYISKMDELEARLKQFGYDSFRQSPELKAERDQFLADMAKNPLYAEWWQDYKEFGSSRTLSSISLMNRVLADEKFMSEYGNTPIWSNAQVYLYHRNVVMQELATREGSIENNDNQDIRDYWDQARADLKRDPEWTSFANRFLNGDNDPEDPGIQIATYYQSPQVGVG
jgi:hypothetical protein